MDYPLIGPLFTTLSDNRVAHNNTWFELFCLGIPTIIIKRKQICIWEYHKMAVYEMSRVMRKPIFPYAKTKVQISCAITAQLTSAFVIT